MVEGIGMKQARIDGNPPTNFDPAYAEKLAAKLNADFQDGWAYKVVSVGILGTRARIMAFDENGEFVAYL